MPVVRLTPQMLKKENSGYLAATKRANEFYQKQIVHLGDSRLSGSCDSLLYWKGLSTFPVSEFSNIIGVIGNVETFTKSFIFTQKVLIIQPNRQCIFILIQSASRRDGNFPIKQFFDLNNYLRTKEFETRPNNICETSTISGKKELRRFLPHTENYRGKSLYRFV